MELNKKKTSDLDSIPTSITHPSQVTPTIAMLSNANLGNLEFVSRVSGLISPSLISRNPDVKSASHRAITPSLSLSSEYVAKKSKTLD